MSSSVSVRKLSVRPDLRASVNSSGLVPIWLDQLPADVCIRIVLYLHPGSFQGSARQSSSLLSLAEASNVQRLAVVSALSHCLHVPKQADQVFWSRWGDVFGDDVHEVSLHTIIPQSRALLRAPKLRQASLLNVPIVLSSLATAHQLRHLELNLIRSSNATADETLSALRELKLESLALFCDVYSVASCMFTEHSHIVTLSTICEGLQSLKLTCSCNHKVHPTWHLLSRLPLLRQIAVDGRSLQTMPDSHIRLLQNMRSISLDGGEITVDAAIRIGVPVTTFRSSWVLKTSKLTALACCSRLAVLQLHLQRDAYRALPNLTKVLPSLNSLHLRALHRGRTLDVDYGNILQAVVNAPSLSNLRLTGLRVDTGELVDVLKHLGLRLMEFETTVDEMDPTQIGQMEALLETAVECNTKLRKFDLISTISVGKRPCHWPSVSRRASKIRLHYDRLRLRAPGLYSWSLEKYIHLLEHDALHEVVYT